MKNSVAIGQVNKGGRTFLSANWNAMAGWKTRPTVIPAGLGRRARR